MKPIAISIIGLPFLLLITGCAINPETGQNQWIVLSEAREIKLGEQASPKFIESYGGQVPSPELSEYVRKIGVKLARKSKRPLLPWKFYVVDSAVINAFALPGGKVFLSRGLLAKLDNEAQLAGIIGHEIGHVTAKHVNDQMAGRLALRGILAGLGTATRNSNDQWLQVLGTGTRVGGTVFLLHYTRQQEYEADVLGVRYMAELGYNPMGQVQVMQILKAERASAQVGPQLLATHPLPQQRISRLRQHIGQRYTDHKSNDFYRFDRDHFHANVKQRLAELPPPKHQEKSEP